MQTEQQSLRAAAGQRFWQIDALRGLALLNMLVYHAMYDWVYIFGHASGWYDIWSTHCHVWQQYICWSFILLSGYSFTLSRRPLKNGLLTAACAVVLTVATAVAMPEEVIWFGVLHLLGCAARPAAQSPAPPMRRGQPHAADLYAAPAGDLRRFIGLAVLGFCINYCPYPAYEGKKLNFL